MSAALALDPTPSQLRAVPLGPESLTWRYAGDTRYILLGLSQAFLLQAAHPIISLGVEEHSTFKTDPHGRFERSVKLLWPVLYNTAEGALEYGMRVREMHRNIKGVGADGKAYHALSPEPYLWVHMTALESMIRYAGYVDAPLTPAQEQQMFAEWFQLGLLLGLREQDMPATLALFRQRFDEILAGRLEDTPTLRYLLAAGYFMSVPRPPQFPLPDTFWRVVRRPVGGLAYLLTRGSMPPAFRERFQVPWSAGDERIFRAVIRTSRLLWTVLPEKVRWLPEALRAIRDARRHPEKYQQPERVTA